MPYEFFKTKDSDGMVQNLAMRNLAGAGVGGVPVLLEAVIAVGPTLIHGRKNAIVDTAVQLDPTSRPLIVGVIVKAPFSNNRMVVVGGAGVTAATGYQLSPGESTPVPLPIDDLNKVWAISETNAPVDLLYIAA